MPSRPKSHHSFGHDHAINFSCYERLLHLNNDRARTIFKAIETQRQRRTISLKMPSRDQVLATLREHAPQLQAEGLAHLRLFGSVARDEASQESDIDLLVDFAPDTRLTLLKLAAIQEQLANLLGHPVEISSPDWMKERIKKQAFQEAIHAF